VSTLSGPGASKSIFDSTGFALFVLIVGLLPLRALRRRVITKTLPPEEYLDDDPPPEPPRRRPKHLVTSGR
jgi:hypothetical protein